MNLATSHMEMLLCSTAVGLPLLTIPLGLMGEFFRAWISFSQHLCVYLVLIFEAMMNFIGQLSMLYLVKIVCGTMIAMVTSSQTSSLLMNRLEGLSSMHRNSTEFNKHTSRQRCGFGGQNVMCISDAQISGRSSGQSIRNHMVRIERVSKMSY